MKKKWNLILSMVAVVFTLAVFTFGVYAATAPSFTISNTITFAPNELAVDIVGKVDGYDKTKTLVLENYEYTVDKTKPLEEQSPQNWDDTALKGLTFVDKTTPIIFTFQITSRIDAKFAVYIADYNTSSTKITNTPSHSITNKLVFEATDEDTMKEITFTIAVKETNNVSFENESNNFKVVIEAVE